MAASPRIIVVTTLTEAGWNDYGQRFYETFLQHWPENCELVIYAEGFMPDASLVTPRTRWRHLHDACPELVSFKERHKDNPGTHGRYGKLYNWRLDAVRFANKVFAYTHCCNVERPEILIWCDADVLAHTPIPPGWLESLAPEDASVAFLDRKHTHPETGFIMFRGDDPDVRVFLRLLCNLYASDSIFNLPEWHDCFAFLVTLNMARKHGLVKAASLSGAANGTDHPFINGPLGAYLDHLKGQRKAAGQSWREDLTWDRPEPYWQGARALNQPAADGR